MRKNEKKKEKVKDKDEDLYDQIGITNYERNIILYKVDHLTDFQIKKWAQKEGRRLGEIIEHNEIDTVIHQEENLDLDIMEEEEKQDDENSEEFEKVRLDIKKSEILTKQKTVTSKSVVKLKWTSFLIIFIHLVMSSIFYVLIKSKINKTLENIMVVEYLFSQLNYTMASVDTVVDIIIYNSQNYSIKPNKDILIDISNSQLQDNAKILYNLNNEINSLSLITEQNLSDFGNFSLVFNYYEKDGTISRSSIDYFEGVLEV